jgi:hypothetical protein
MKPTMPAKTEPLDLGIDRSDRSIAICLMAGDAVLESAEIVSDPAILQDWWINLRKRHGNGLIRVAFEQPALNLLLFFGPLPNTEVYPLNPSIIWNYRQSLKLSRAHTDQSDAACIARFLKGHHSSLRPYQAPDSKARALHAPQPVPPQTGRPAHRPHQPPPGCPQAVLPAGPRAAARKHSSADEPRPSQKVAQPHGPETLP